MSTTWVPAPPATDSFGSRLRLLRLAMNDATVEQMAKACGFPGPTWRAWEKGASPHKMAKVIEQIHRATNVDMVWLMWGTPPAGGASIVPQQGGDETPPDLPTAQSRCIGRSLSEDEAFEEAA